MANPAIVALSGNDTVVINGVVLTGLADGTVGKITFPNKLVDVKIGKNGNALFAQNATGKYAELEIRLVRGCTDDQTLNTTMIQMNSDFVDFPLLTAQVTKRLGNGGTPNSTPTVINDQYFLDSGVFLMGVEVETNVEGNTDQVVSVYKMGFANSLLAIPRIIG